MDSEIAKEVIGVIRAEGQRRSEQLKDADPDFAYDQWLFTDEPFINEMCLMVLVTLHHLVERELLLLVARSTAQPATMTSQQYQMNVKKWQKKGPKKRRTDLSKALSLSSFGEWDTSMVDWPPVLRQTVKTQNPSNGEMSHGSNTQAVHAGV